MKKFEVVASIPIITKKVLAGVPPDYQVVEGAFKLIA